MTGSATKTMRVEALLLCALGLSVPAQAAEPAQQIQSAEPRKSTQSVAPPDPALLEFLADWSEDDRQWLDVELNNTQTDGVANAPTARETNHE